MKSYKVKFNYNIGTAAGTPGAMTQTVHDVPDHLTGQARLDHLKTALERDAPRVVRDIEILI